MGFEKVWYANYFRVQDFMRHKWHPSREKVLVAFNTNIDTVHRLSAKNIERAAAQAGVSVGKNPPGEITTNEGFLSNLFYAIKTSSAREIVCKNPAVEEWADETFPPCEERIGGQAGIMANFLSGLGMEVVLYTPALSKKQASFLNKAVECPRIARGRLKLVPAKSAANSDVTKVNRIFEFKKGLAAGGAVSSRANRFILASRPPGLEPVFSGDLEPHFPEMLKGVHRMIVSGFQSEKVGDKKHFARAEEQIKKIRRLNPKLLIHLEEAFISSKGLEREIIDYVARNVQSIGMNEVEVRQVAACVLGRDAKAPDSIHGIYHAGLGIAKKLGLSRVHIHHMGYYLAIVRQDYPASPETVRDGLILASLAAYMRAKTGRLPTRREIVACRIGDISKEGMQEIANLQSLTLCPGFSGRGICQKDGHYIIIVPTLVCKNPKTTVGLGDVISSSAFAGEGL